jgi:hypothetical protein
MPHFQSLLFPNDEVVLQHPVLVGSPKLLSLEMCQRVFDMGKIFSSLPLFFTIPEWLREMNIHEDSL